MPSFFCERTAEYALVPALQKHLATNFKIITPIFYWKTREGNQTSLRIHEHQSVRILAMFARRPKTTGNANLMLGKINSEIIQFSHAADSAGIITVAGFPAARSLNELYSNPPIFWLRMETLKAEDFHFSIDLSKQRPKPIDRDGKAATTMTPKQIIQKIEADAKPMSWKSAMQHISELRLEYYREDTDFHFAWFGGYKPVYLLLPSDENILARTSTQDVAN